MSEPFRKARLQSSKTAHTCRITAQGKNRERPCSEQGSRGLADTLKPFLAAGVLLVISVLHPKEKAQNKTLFSVKDWPFANCVFSQLEVFFLS